MSLPPVDGVAPPVRGAVRMRRPGRDEDLWVLQLPLSQTQAVEQALPFWARGHRNHLNVYDVGIVDDLVTIVFDGAGHSILPAHLPLHPVRAARITLEVVDLLLEARNFGLHHGHLDVTRLRIVGGSPRLFVGDPRAVADDLTGARRLLQDLAGPVDQAPTGWPVGLSEALDPGLDLQGLRNSLAGFIASPVALGLLRLDDAIALVERFDRDVADTARVVELFEFFRHRDDLIRAHRFADSLWEHLGGALVSALRRGTDTDETTRAVTWFLERLPAAEAVLIALVADPDEPEPARAAAARTLGVRQCFAATGPLALALNEPLPQLHDAARWALDRIPKTQPAHLEKRRLAIIPCSHGWEELMPMTDPTRPEQRFCADCDRPVHRVTDLLGLARIGENTCAFLDAPESATITVHTARGGRRLRVGKALVLGDADDVAFDVGLRGLRLLNVGSGQLAVCRSVEGIPQERLVQLDELDDYDGSPDGAPPRALPASPSLPRWAIEVMGIDVLKLSHREVGLYLHGHLVGDMTSPPQPGESDLVVGNPDDGDMLIGDVVADWTGTSHPIPSALKTMALDRMSETETVNSRSSACGLLPRDAVGARKTATPERIT